MKDITYYIGFKTLKEPKNIRKQVLDWFAMQLDKRGVKPDDIDTMTIQITLRNETCVKDYGFGALSAEMDYWAKREYDIKPKLCFSQDRKAEFYGFRLTITL